MMTLFAVMATLTAAFGIVMYNAFVNSVRFYGFQPGDLKTLIALLTMFSAAVGVSGYLLTKALDWIILIRRFKQEFGFKPPNDPLQANMDERDRRAVDATLASIHRYNSIKKHIDTALLAEKFGFIVYWPEEYRAEWARAHR